MQNFPVERFTVNPCRYFGIAQTSIDEANRYFWNADAALRTFHVEARKFDDAIAWAVAEMTYANGNRKISLISSEEQVRCA